MKKITVFVAGFEAKSAVSGWSWFFNKSDADKNIAEIKNDIVGYPNVITYEGEVSVEIPNSIDESSEYGKEYINGEVEMFLEEHDFEKAFL
ncbi:MAG TPA: hypothetical protein VNX68_13990 [Nitrosopumilaceae archaeon]|jgi:hypothetical protein|nr:hypothetical protein [Nitrosopumilaceae archaeon]